MTLTLDNFKKCIDQLADYLMRVFLFDEGEPLLHHDIFKMVSYAESENISTIISTNLSMKFSDDRIDELILSGLSHLIVAIDGMTQEVYEKYRVNGDLKLVMSNLERIIASKRKSNLKKLLIEMQYIDFGYNRFQIEVAKKYAKNVGVDRLTIFPSLPSKHNDLIESRLSVESDRQRIRKGCFDLWAIADIDCMGDLYSCDFGEDMGMEKIGSLLENSFDELWNCSKMTCLRDSFNRNSLQLEFKYCKICPSSQTIPFFLR